MERFPLLGVLHLTNPVSIMKARPSDGFHVGLLVRKFNQRFGSKNGSSDCLDF